MTTTNDSNQNERQAGRVSRHWLEVGQSWQGPVRVPLAVVHGTTPGAKLVVLACQHGDEGNGVIALLDFINTAQPAQISGEVWVVPCANVHGFIVGHRNSPYDQQDMNRVHPGNPQGTMSEQIAHVLHRDIFPGADLIIDLHGGSPENGDTAFGMWADADGKPSVLPIISSMKLDFLIAKRKSLPGMLSNTAAELGIPQISIEAGSALDYPRNNGALMRDFITTAMQHLQMLPGPAPAPQALPLMNSATHRAHTGGAWKTLVSFRENVQKGQQLGVIMDLLGNVTQDVRAIESGIVAVMRTGVRVHPGETVTTLAVPTGETSPGKANSGEKNQ